MQAIQPNVWGPSAWSLLHRMSFRMTNASEAREFFQSLENILPCPKCRRNLIEHFGHLPFPTKASAFGMWAWKLHNRVNDSLGHSMNGGRPTFSEVQQLYKPGELGNTAPPQCELTFLMAVAETHPGANKVTGNYLHALHTFLSTWSKYSGVVAPNMTTIQSRSTFRKWVKKQMGNRNAPHFSECSV